MGMRKEEKNYGDFFSWSGLWYSFQNPTQSMSMLTQKNLNSGAILSLKAYNSK